MRVISKRFNDDIQKAQLLLIERDPQNKSGLLGLAGFDSDGLVLSDNFFERYALRPTEAILDYLNDVERFLAGKPVGSRVDALTNHRGRLYPKSVFASSDKESSVDEWALHSSCYSKK